MFEDLKALIEIISAFLYVCYNNYLKGDFGVIALRESGIPLMDRLKA